MRNQISLLTNISLVEIMDDSFVENFVNLEFCFDDILSRKKKKMFDVNLKTK